MDYSENPNTGVYLACVAGQGSRFNELKNSDSSSCQVVLLRHFAGDLCIVCFRGRLRSRSLLGDYNRATFASLNKYFIVNIVVFNDYFSICFFPNCTEGNN